MLVHTAVISIGSNLPCCVDILEDAVARLGVVCRVVRSSGLYFGPDDTGRGPRYANSVLEITTAMDCAGLREFARGLEAAAGRTPESKQLGLMPLDIDIVLWDGEIVNQYDFGRQYFREGYALINQEVK